MPKSTTVPTEAAEASLRARPHARVEPSPVPARGPGPRPRDARRRGPARGDARAPVGDCRGATALAGAYLAGLLRGADGDAFRRHVRGCEPCHQKILAVQLFLLLAPEPVAPPVGRGAAGHSPQGGRR